MAQIPQLSAPPGKNATVLAKPNLVLVFWGDPSSPSGGLFWNNHPDFVVAGTRFFIEFLRGYNVEPLITQYGVNIGQINSVATITTAVPDSDRSIAGVLAAAINSGQLNAPGSSPYMLYVFIQDPTTPTAPTTPTSIISSGSAAQHTAGSSQRGNFIFLYSLMSQDETNAASAPLIDGFTWWTRASDYTALVSHELYEAFTDPSSPAGWTYTGPDPADSNKVHTSECCDVCNDRGIGSVRYGPWTIEYYASNHDNNCVSGFNCNWVSLGAPPGMHGSVAVGQNANASGQSDGTGAWSLFAVTQKGDLWTYSGNTANTRGGAWTGGTWKSLVNGAGLSGPPVVAKDVTLGLLEVFAISTANSRNGELWHIYQTAPNGPWSAGESLGAPPNCAIMGNVSIGQHGANPSANGFRALEAFVIGSDGQLHHIWQLGPWKGWSGWGDSLGAPPTGIAPPVIVDDYPEAYAGPTVATNADGRLEVFVLGNDNAFWHIWQTAPNGGWSAWASLSLILVPIFPSYQVVLPQSWRGSLQCGVQPNGSLELFVTATDGNIYHNWQVAANGDWSGWHVLMPLGIPQALQFTGFPSATDGSKLIQQGQVFVIGSDGALWTAYQGGGGQWQLGAFQPWRFLGAPPSGNPNNPLAMLLKPHQTPVIAVARGGLTVFVIGPDGNVWSLSQTAPFGPWGMLIAA